MRALVKSDVMPVMNGGNGADGSTPQGALPAGQEAGVRNRPGLYPAPIWDGYQPEKFWVKKRREIRLWAKDSDLEPKRLGVRLWRGLIGQAAT